jgi:hypothetical protein
MGRDSLFVWFAERDQILKIQERFAIIRRLRKNEDSMRLESRRFWMRVNREQRKPK